MKHLKSYKLFESSDSESEPWAGDISEIIRDYKDGFIDLGFDVSDPQVTTYQVNDNKFISCLYFEVSTPLDGIELVSECYDALSELESRLKNTDFGVFDISFEMYSDLPLMSLDNVYEVYGGTEWECLKIYIHKPIDRNEIEISSDDEWPFQNEEEE